MHRLAPLLLVLPLLLACGAERGTLKRLPSGRTFEILQAGQVRFEKTGATAAVLVYRSHRDPADQAHLEAEAQELWEAFRPEVEAKGLTTAILQADCASRGLLLAQHASVGFVYERQPDGSWHRTASTGR